MDDAGISVGGRRRNLGWLYVFDEDLHLIARPSAAETDLPENVDSLVQTAAMRWARQAWRGEMLTMLSPTISAHVFSLQGPSGTCVVVYLERFYTRAKR
ncbi:MAG: hypothetical protein JO322_14240 [Candidatus Eremiobacteraeota bacterium]|nr:hypothetical protein [Candidatus Eremiobacteraeota bacterium]